MLILAMIYYAIFFFVLQDLEFMHSFAKWLGIFAKDVSGSESAGWFFYRIFYSGFHYWAAFVLTVVILAVQNGKRDVTIG